jgi:hypothetical protein
MSRTRRPLVVLAMVALIGAGCSNGSAKNGDTGKDNSKNALNQKAMKFAECMRDNGVREFPDPEASGGLTIDEIANGSSLDVSSVAWKKAIAACKDLQPPGFTGHKAGPQEQKVRLKFAQCMRESGVEDFPDPANGEPLVNTNRIPSSGGAGGMSILDAAMQKCGDAFSGELGLGQ